MSFCELQASSGRLASNTLPLINVCGAVCVGVAVCGSNTLPLLIVFGSEWVWDQLIVLNYLVILLHVFISVIFH